MPRSCELQRRVESLGTLFAFLEGSLTGGRIDEDTRLCLKLSAEELFTNMVRHNVSRGDTISVALEISDDSIKLELTDHDVEPFDPDSVEPVDVHRPVEERQPGGLGMHLVRSIVDRVSYGYADRELTVSVVKNLGEVSA